MDPPENGPCGIRVFRRGRPDLYRDASLITRDRSSRKDLRRETYAVSNLSIEKVSPRIERKYDEGRTASSEFCMRLARDYTQPSMTSFLHFAQRRRKFANKPLNRPGEDSTNRKFQPISHAPAAISRCVILCRQIPRIIRPRYGESINRRRFVRPRYSCLYQIERYEKHEWNFRKTVRRVSLGNSREGNAIFGLVAIPGPLYRKSSYEKGKVYSMHKPWYH